MSKVTTKAKIQTKGEKANFYILKLRPHVTWSEDTIDNEHLNRKRSKKCCIYHKPLEFGESSSDCDSDQSDWVDSSDVENE